MGKIVKETKEKKIKKKKGRPSLLDLQKRKQQQQQQQQEEKNRNPNPNLTNNRSTRRNPNHQQEGVSVSTSSAAAEAEETSVASEEVQQQEDDDDDDERREKKLKFVVRLPPNQSSSSVSPSSYLNGDYPFDSSNNNLEDGDGNPHKKQKIDDQKGGKHDSISKAIGTPFVFGPTTSLPDKQLLVFILDRLQKKDSYSVFSEPVDPEELPDYHEIIKNPMDFGTVRKKLDVGVYANLEEFEGDVFLICSNAMKYNAADTIYFRQARSIQELAKKNFENLRQETGGEVVREPKRRGRPPKHLKKPLGRPPLDRAGSDFSSDVALATGVEKTGYNLRKGHVSDKSSPADASGRTRYNESNWLGEHKSEKNDEFSGSMYKGMSTKYGKKLSDVDDTRRDTYKQCLPSGGNEASVLTAFDGEKKQLLAVGLHVEHGYAKSLARFAATLGPVAWNVAARKIARSLPAGTRFGPGWVGENEAPATQPHLIVPSSTQPVVPQQSYPISNNSQSSITPEIFQSDGNKVLSKDVFPESNVPSPHPNRTLHPSNAASTSTAPEPNAENMTARGVNSGSGVGVTNNNLCGIRPPSQVHQNPVMSPPLNGLNGTFASPMAKLGRPSWQAGSFNSDTSAHTPRMPELDSGNNNNFTPPANHLQSVSVGAGFHYPQPTWRPSSALQQKTNAVPPDLNVRFQLPGSPNPAGGRVGSPQPDLALQL